MKVWYLLTLRIVTISVLIIASCKLDAQDVNLNILPSDDFKTILDKTVNNQKIPGMVAAIVDSTGVIQIESAGIRKMKSSELMTIQDKLHLGSCTKAMTSAMLAILIDEKILNWESTIGEIFSKQKDSIHSDYHEVTLHQLVRHIGGINGDAANWWQYSSMEKNEARRKEIKERRAAILLDNLKKAPTQKPGEFLYSNLGYMIAGVMAEKVTGLSWEELMKQKLFDPLGMSSAGFGAPGTKGEIDQPWGHTNAWSSGWNPMQGDNPEALGPAGTAHCSIEDWGKFVTFMFLNKDQELLSQNQLENLKTTEGDYAAGWGLAERDWAQGRAYTHSGSNTMWLSVAWVAPEIGKAYLVVINAYDQNAHKICDGVIGHLLKLDKVID